MSVQPCGCRIDHEHVRFQCQRHEQEMRGAQLAANRAAGWPAASPEPDEVPADKVLALIDMLRDGRGWYVHRLRGEMLPVGDQMVTVILRWRPVP